MARVAGNIDLLLPGLFDLPDDARPPPQRMPGLARLLRFARPLANRAHSIDANIAEMLRLPGAAAGARGLPVAPAFDPAAPDGGCVLFEAVHLRPDMQQAIVVPVGREPIDLDEFRRLVAALAAEFGGDFECEEMLPGLYLMRLRALRAPEGYPHPLSVLGKPANAQIERGQAGLAWYRLLIEIQMFLHGHAVNDARRARGAAPINSLWFWGAGSPGARPGRRPAWICDDPVLRRFGRHLGLDCAGLDALGAARGDVALVDLRLLERLKGGAGDDLEPLLADIDARLLQPSLTLVRRRRATLRLRAASERDWRLGPWSLRCFWRRPPRSLIMPGRG